MVGPLPSKLQEYVQRLPPTARCSAEDAMRVLQRVLEEEDAALLESMREVKEEDFVARQATLARLQHDLRIVQAFARVLGGQPLPQRVIPYRKPPAE